MIKDELLHVIVFCDFDLENPLVCNKASQSTKTLPSTSSNSQQECISHWLSQYPSNPGNMFASIHKQNQLHSSLPCFLVILLLEFVEFGSKYFWLWELTVDTGFLIFTVIEISEYYTIAIQNFFVFQFEYFELIP